FSPKLALRGEHSALFSLPLLLPTPCMRLDACCGTGVGSSCSDFLWPWPWDLNSHYGWCFLWRSLSWFILRPDVVSPRSPSLLPALPLPLSFCVVRTRSP